MSDAFADYLSRYLKEHAAQFNRYLTAALNSKDQTILYLESSSGINSRSADLRNCEFLSSAGLFEESMRYSRNGRNFYKCFKLTEMGRRFAEQLEPQSPIVSGPQQKPP